MSDYQHPFGNYKVNIVKFFAKILSSVSLFFLSFLFKIDKNKNEIIISSAFHAPWKDDKDFFNFYNEINRRAKHIYESRSSLAVSVNAGNTFSQSPTTPKLASLN